MRRVLPLHRGEERRDDAQSGTSGPVDVGREGATMRRVFLLFHDAGMNYSTLSDTFCRIRAACCG